MAANDDHILTIGSLDALTDIYGGMFAAKDAMTASDLETATSTDQKTVSPKVMADYVSGEIDEALGVVANGSY